MYSTVRISRDDFAFLSRKGVSIVMPRPNDGSIG